MSGNGYGYYYPPTGHSYPAQNANPNWSEWSLEQQQYNETYGRSSAQHSLSAHTNSHTSSYGAAPPPPPPSNSRAQNYYSSSSSRHFPQQRRYNNSNQAFSANQSQNWSRNNYIKRPRPLDSPIDAMEAKSKSSKKKKKPLSQNIPSKKDWTMEEAEIALNVEKEYNKKFKNHSLIIKFPDLELNRDIVSKFHASIENVHFQQPSTPRFCFVSLEENADPTTVIKHLNTVKFGDGYLTAEFKKDREEDQNIRPDDIDPCTLYVGNLAQEVTKEDVVKAYPKGRRIDIGYAKKMKYTRYAFVSFKCVTDSVEAFKRTHSTQMYSKSLIVRFRRLHGTVGMPGESKPQSPAKNKDANQVEPPAEPPEDAIDLNSVKQERSSDDEGEPIPPKDSPFIFGEINAKFQEHHPIVKNEIKEELESVVSSSEEGTCPVPINVEVKTEAVKIEVQEESSDDEDTENGLGNVNFDSFLNELVDHTKKISSLTKTVP